MTDNGETMAPLRVGVVGAGPWAQRVHGPMFASHPGTTLSGIWARSRDASQALATELGSQSFEDYDEFLDSCDAVAFAVPPNVQVDLGIRAAEANKSLLLEKPIALDVESAQRLVDAVDRTGVTTQVVLTWRYSRRFRSFLDDAQPLNPIGARGEFVLGSGLGGPFATPWRLDYGSLFDLGPHLIDALGAALGKIVNIRAHGDSRRWVGLLLEHESGVVSEGSLSISSNVDPPRANVEIFDEAGVCEVDMSGPPSPETLSILVDEFIDTAHGSPHPIDVHHGLYLQRLLNKAADDLRTGA
jgi:predicted dehydrogenase